MYTPYSHAEETLTRLPPAARGSIDVLPPRWATMETAFADTGGWVSGSDLAELIRQHGRQDDGSPVLQPISLVARWIVSGDVIAVSTPWGDMLPLFQFDLPRAAIRPEVVMVCAELGCALTQSELARWFVSPNEWLQGERPVLVLHTRLPDVRRAARRVAMGGE